MFGTSGFGGGMPGFGGGMPGFGVGMPGMGGGMPGMVGGMPGIPYQNMNMMNQGMNIGGNWTSMYNIGQTNNNNNINNNYQGTQMGNKKNVVFKTTMGIITNVLIDYGKTMTELLKVYLTRVDKMELFNTKNTIAFLFNAKKIEWLDDTKVEIFFRFTPQPTIVVNDMRGLIGA